jgi:RNA polymerase sigma-70 factor (ECF subfamily)
MRPRCTGLPCSSAVIQRWRTTLHRRRSSGPGLRAATEKAYLFTIARNLYRDYLRRNRRNTELDESMADSAPSLALRTEQKEEVDAVMTALRELPEADRAALLMRAQESMPYEEIAQALGLPVTTVKVKVHRARLKLMRVREAFQEVRS